MTNENLIRPTVGSINTNSSAKPLFCFWLLCVAMFTNLFLSFANAHGLPVNANLLIIVQAFVTLLACPAMISRNVVHKQSAILVLCILIFSAVVTNIVNPVNPKSFYDTMVIPIYIALGASAVSVRPKWMHALLVFVIFITLLEVVAPKVYTGIFEPGRYFAATREWIASQKANAAADDGFYNGAYRAGGAQFSFTDHRVSGPFLEPISLGYFAFVMSIYYAGLYSGKTKIKVAGIVSCLCLALSADSRIPTALILLAAVFLGLRLRLPVIILWLTFPVTMIVTYLLYLIQPDFLYGDTFSRMSITFDGMASVNVGELLIGIVPLNRVGDSGILYMIRCVGGIGALLAIWYYSGCYTRAKGTNVAFFVMVTVYLSISLMFGGATLSIKTSSLLGYLIGLAGRPRISGVPA
jgi:hypothetical protein